MIQDGHLPIIRTPLVGQHLPVSRGAPRAGHHLPEAWNPGMMPRPPISWIDPAYLAKVRADGEAMGTFTDRAGCKFNTGIGAVIMRHKIIDGFDGIGISEASIGQGFISDLNYPIGRFASFAVFRRTAADSAPSNYSDWYMSHGYSPTDSSASGGGNYIWGRGSGLSQISTTGNALSKTSFSASVSPTATTVGTTFTISGGSRPGKVCWGKINGVQPVGTVDGSIENSLHNNYLNKTDSRIYVATDSVTAPFRSKGILLEFLYFNYAVNESDENQIHDYLRRKYKHY